MKNTKKKENKSHDVLSLSGVSQNNLKDISLNIPHDSFTVVTGVSGSGKSTLAFDTIYAEGGRRYIETFSPYTRQFLDRLARPDATSIDGVRPALALEQRNKINNSRSTVGTVTEVNEYLKIIWSNIAELRCEKCDTQIRKESPARVAEVLTNKAQTLESELLYVCFSISISGTASLEALINTLNAEGHIRYFDWSENTVKRIDTLKTLPKNGELTLLVDRVKISNSAEKLKKRLVPSLTQAYHFGKGKLTTILYSDSRKTEVFNFSEGLECNTCEKKYPAPRPSLFSFNSALGACPECRGFGQVLLLDSAKCIPDPRLTIKEGAISCWDTKSTTIIKRKLFAFCESTGIPTDVPFKKLSNKQQNSIIQGEGKFGGLHGWYERLARKRHKMHIRMMMARYRSEFDCPKCKGSRLTSAALRYLVLGKTLPEVSALSLDKALEFAKELQKETVGDDAVEIAISELVSRLSYLIEIGLSYVSLDRQSRTLSGGESQRVSLTSILGSRLVNTLLVLDEPTVGLHSRDTARLIESIKALRDRGNTVVIVEHDLDVIRAADHVIDLGPGAGEAGGQIVFEGSVAALKKSKTSLTAKYLNKHLPVNPSPQSSKKAATLELKGASAHNLKNIDVTIPLSGLTVLSGASGSGKSTLVSECLFKAYSRLKEGMSPLQLKNSKDIALSSLKGLKAIEEIVLIDQSSIAKSPRSNPATYTGAWDTIREALASTEQAERLGLTKSAFSFNVDGGRCPACKGAGALKIEMQFLADVFVTCEVCRGSRFQDSVLNVRYLGHNVVEFLGMSLENCKKIFLNAEEAPRRKVLSAIQPLLDLGLGYLRLGHPLNTVSGGEAQRIKLASYLDKKVNGKRLFIIDEPTTGLHPENVRDLLSTLSALVTSGNSILCIEHNIDVIAAADYVIDLGPEGGEKGGRIVAEGHPSDIAKKASNYKESRTAAYLASYHSKSQNSALHFTTKARKKVVTRANKDIQISGAREHNLKNISVTIPNNKLVAVTGVSGSGKSTLAFDIVFAEGQRRFIDCLSPYARQYIKQLSIAELDQLQGIPPTIAISQKTAAPSGISTVATTTEIYQFLRLLFSKVGTQHCVKDNTEITSRSSDSIISAIKRQFKGKRVQLFAPVVSGRKGYYNDLFNRALRAEIDTAKIDGKIIKLSPELRLERHKLHWISLAVASMSTPEKAGELLETAVEQCLILGNGVVEVYSDDLYAEPSLFSIDRVCPTCGTGYRELDPQDFSFRSARGICSSCSGRGSVAIGLSERKRTTCPECEGARIAPIARHVYLGGKAIHQLTAMTASQLLTFFNSVKFESRLSAVVDPVLKELRSRLELVSSIGLDYLPLDRDAATLSGGEAQRLRLAKALGSPLSGVCYILDEPSIGLHPQDHDQLLTTLHELRDRGNTVLIVEHDEDTIRAADHIIDVGPHGGTEGGSIVYTGSVAGIESCEESLTGQALAERSAFLPFAEKAKAASTLIRLSGAKANTLKKVDVSFPHQQLSVVCGVSGAGKSSLVHGSLVPAIVESFEGEEERVKFYDKTWKELSGLDTIERFVEIDQSPIGKTRTSTPLSYLKIFDLIRNAYAATNEAKTRGWTASHFSYNTGKGRCEECAGRGSIVVPMSFLPDAETPCETCNSLRYNEETLDIEYQGVSLGALLQLTFDEVYEIFKNHKKIERSLKYVLDLGLGYLGVGQATYTLSGGEAQRIKIAKELGLREAKNTLYILDEPTIGLHMTDVEKLRNVLSRLIEAGNTVIVIEHNMDIIRSADHLIEMGPGPGEAGGSVLFEGAPKKLALRKKRSPTQGFLAQSVGFAKTANL